jgi:hypothetical protein
VDLSRVAEIELRWLATRPGLQRLRYSGKELAAVREALRRALLHCHADREVVNRVLHGFEFDPGETTLELGERLAARARALGPHGATRWGEVTAASARVFALGRVHRPGVIASLLRSPGPPPSLPAGFDFTREPREPPQLVPAWVSAAERGPQLPAVPVTGDPEMDLMAAQVLQALAEDSSASSGTGP